MKLDALQVLILDEADKMLDMGFAQEMSDILQFVPDQRQTLLFSATLDGQVGGLVRDYTNDPIPSTGPFTSELETFPLDRICGKRKQGCLMMPSFT